MMSLRMAEERDLGEIGRVLGSLQRFVGVGVAEADRLGRVLTEIIESPHAALIVAADGSSLAGVISLWFRPNLLHAGDVALIDELVVDERFRRQGVGASLVAEAIRVARSRGCIEVEVSTERGNEGARKLYARFGFEERGLQLELDLR